MEYKNNNCYFLNTHTVFAIFPINILTILINYAQVKPEILRVIKNYNNMHQRRHDARFSLKYYNVNCKSQTSPQIYKPHDCHGKIVFQVVFNV